MIARVPPVRERKERGAGKKGKKIKRYPPCNIANHVCPNIFSETNTLDFEFDRSNNCTRVRACVYNKLWSTVASARLRS